MEVEINSINELINFIKSKPLKMDQLKRILAEGYNIFFDEEPKEEIVCFLEKYKDSENIPLFITDPLE